MVEKNIIFVGAIAKDEDRKKFLEIGRVIEVLKEGIDLSDYGSGVSTIYYIPMGVPVEDDFHPEKIAFRPRKKELDIRLKLDYLKMKQATDEEFLQLVAQLFLSSIDRFPQRRIPDFDIPAFKADVARVFRERGWVA